LFEKNMLNNRISAFPLNVPPEKVTVDLHKY